MIKPASCGCEFVIDIIMVVAERRGQLGSGLWPIHAPLLLLRATGEHFGLCHAHIGLDEKLVTR